MKRKKKSFEIHRETCPTRCMLVTLCSGFQLTWHAHILTIRTEPIRKPEAKKTRIHNVVWFDDVEPAHTPGSSSFHVAKAQACRNCIHNLSTRARHSAKSPTSHPAAGGCRAFVCSRARARVYHNETNETRVRCQHRFYAFLLPSLAFPLRANSECVVYKCVLTYISKYMCVCFFLLSLSFLWCSLRSESVENGANSTLLIAKINKSDSGNYTCSINSSHSFTVLVHVLNGKYWCWYYILYMYLCVYGVSYVCLCCEFFMRFRVRARKIERKRFICLYVRLRACHWRACTRAAKWAIINDTRSTLAKSTQTEQKLCNISGQPSKSDWTVWKGRGGVYVSATRNRYERRTITGFMTELGGWDGWNWVGRFHDDGSYLRSLSFCVSLRVAFYVDIFCESITARINLFCRCFSRLYLPFSVCPCCHRRQNQQSNNNKNAHSERTTYMYSHRPFRLIGWFCESAYIKHADRELHTSAFVSFPRSLG